MTHVKGTQQADTGKVALTQRLEHHLILGQQEQVFGKASDYGSWLRTHLKPQKTLFEATGVQEHSSEDSASRRQESPAEAVVFRPHRFVLTLLASRIADIGSAGTSGLLDSRGLVLQVSKQGKW